MKNKNTGAFSGGIGVSSYKNVNKLYEEEKFHARQGHGFAAERANHLYDKLTGKDAKIIGDDNAKNGADRIVDGQSIQSKYCKSGSSCVNECFDSKGNFRYMENGKPMKIEVPSDKYNDAVKAMEEKIRRGQVEGVSDPKEASKIIRKGHFTYEQARNIAKAGTVVGGILGSILGGTVANKTTDAVLGNFIEDDAEEMIRKVEREFSEMAIEYLLNKNEANKCIDILQKELDGSKLKDIYESSDRSEYIRNILTPIIERVTNERRRVKLPTSKDMTSSLRMVLEEISDEVNRASLA